MRLRSKFESSRKVGGEDFMDTAEESWENYESILERASKEIQFPPLAIWDILDNFIIQLTKFHEYRFTLSDKEKENS